MYMKADEKANRLCLFVLFGQCRRKKVMQCFSLCTSLQTRDTSHERAFFSYFCFNLFSVFHENLLFLREPKIIGSSETIEKFKFSMCKNNFRDSID